MANSPGEITSTHSMAARVRAALDSLATYRDEMEEEAADAIEASRIAQDAWASRLRLQT
jgi:hypothetical protein